MGSVADWERLLSVTSSDGRNSVPGIDPLPHSARGPGMIPTSDAASEELACSPCDQVAYHQEFHFPPMSQRRAGL